MNNSYIENINSSFPKIKMPLTEEQLVQIEKASALKLQTKYIVKSERIQELEKELAVARNLSARAEKLFKVWDLNSNHHTSSSKNMPKFRYYKPLPFNQYWLDGTWIAVSARTDSLRNVAEQYSERMDAVTKKLCDMLASAKDNLEYALDIESKGNDGENKVENFLRRKLDGRILTSVILPSANSDANAPKTAETDLLVISHHGIFVCEVKNYGKAGQTLEVQSDGEIVKRDYYGRLLEYMGSPFKQNARHCAAVQTVLTEAGLGYLPVYPVVIIANTDVNVVNNSRYTVMDMYGFSDMVSARATGTEYNKEQQQAAYAAIQAKRMTERKFPITAITPVAAELESAIASMEAATEEHTKDGGWNTKSKETVDNWVAGVENEWKRRHPFLCAFYKLRYNVTVWMLPVLFVSWVLPLFLNIFEIHEFNYTEQNLEGLLKWNMLYVFIFFFAMNFIKRDVKGKDFSALIKIVCFTVGALVYVAAMLYHNFIWLA